MKRDWRGRLPEVLDARAARRETVTYAALAADLGVPPPQRIQQLARALEQLMKSDADAGRPLRAALVVSQARGGLPAPGFFAAARALGRHDGAESGPEAARFHADELAALWEAAGHAG